jgi:hypothetical protein
LNKQAKGFLTGLALGLLGPVALLLLFFLWKGGDASFLEFIARQAQARLLAPVLSLCALANLGSFWLLISRQQYTKVKGVILATLFLGIVIVLLKFQS